MRSLFLKIFLWFWLAIVLVAGAAMLSAFWLRPAPDAEAARWRHFVGSILSIQGRAAVEIFQRNGPTALREHLEREEHAVGRQLLLFDRQGAELTGRPMPASAVNLALDARASAPGDVSRSVDAALVATPVQDSTGELYVIMSELPAGPARPVTAAAPQQTDEPREPHAHLSPRKPPLAARLLRDLTEQPQTLGLVILAVIVTGGAVCYGLARYLTSPVRKLSAATRRLASGELAARVGPHLGKRRDELGNLGRDFDLMAERLEALVSGQRQLLRDISHELRSPLARLSVALGLARRATPAEANPPLDRIEREAERLNDLIGQLLTLSRLESGAAQPESVPIALTPLIQQIAADADFEAVGRGRHVAFAAAADCTVVGSPELLRRAIENVIRNAVQHTREGSPVDVSLRCETGPVPRAVIEVRDHGPGVPDAAQRDIFRPFYRVDDARDRTSGGTGLGLAITAQAVRWHGGTVSATNAEGGGLAVRIDLPCAASTTS